TKENMAKLSIIAVGLLIIMKIIASVFTGSISIRADALHSFIDLTGVIIGYIGIKVSAKPPDEKHAFGHGKAESIAGIVISGLIFLAAGMIAYEAITRIINGGVVELVDVGILITIIAIVINSIVSWLTLKVASDSDSVVLETTARHMFADVLSSVAVLVGLVVVRFTGLQVLDPVVALLVALLIVRTAYVAMKKNLVGLMDARLPKAEENIITSFIDEHNRQVVGFHNVRTRKSGNLRYIDLHLVVPRHTRVEDAHNLCDHLEDEIEDRLQFVDITIHVEPCAVECHQCVVFCTARIGSL
ncbi:MAG: cation transporter, partial [Dehalococcoidia bacterium]